MKRKLKFVALGVAMADMYLTSYLFDIYMIFC